MEPDQIVSALRRHAPLALAHIVLGAIIGLAVPGIEVEDIATTTKTLPDFANMWTKLVAHG